MQKFDWKGVINLSQRSPFSAPKIFGLPPASIPAPDVTTVGGVPTVNGTPLNPYGVGVQEAVMNTKTPSAQQSVTQGAQSQYTPGMYGDAVAIPVVFAGAGEVIALRRPNQTRISLLIQNLTVVGNIFYSFDRTADNVSCVAIGPGGNRLFDTAVAQGDLHIFSTGAGTVIVEYINQDISNPRNVS